MMAPDLAEARRLFTAGLQLCKLKPFKKQPEGDEWNKRPITTFDEKATGYGLMLPANGLCSADPDNAELSAKILAGLGFDMEAVMAAGVRTGSTRPGSGGRSVFRAHPDLEWIQFKFKGISGVVLELRAGSPNLQDVIPGLLYKDRQGRIRTQKYINEKRLDSPPALPADFLAWWQRMSTDITFRREQQIKAGEIIGHKAHPSVSDAKGERLAFPSSLRRDFNAEHQVEDFLVKHGYEDDGRGRYKAPDSEGAPGVRQIPGKDDLWQSDHGSDPLNGTFDAWITYVVLEHDGDQTTAELAYQAIRDARISVEFDDALVTAANGTGDTTEPQATEKQTPRYLYDLNRLKPVEYVVDGFIANGLTVIAGAPGVGKTSLLVPLAAVVAHLIPSSIVPALRRKVLYISEAVEQVETVLYGLTKALPDSAPPVEFSQWFILFRSKRKTAADLGALIKRAVEKLTVEQGGYSVGPLIVLDTSNANVELANENDNAEVGRVIAAIKENLGSGACWLVQHTSKANNRSAVEDMSARGASAFAGDANATAYIFREDDIPDKRFMWLGKYRFEAAYREVEFSTQTFAETVDTPWGIPQQMTYRVGLPSPSNTAARIAERDARKEDEAYAEVSQRVAEILSDAIEPLSASMLAKEIGGKADITRKCIKLMIERNALVESGQRKSGHPLYRLAELGDIVGTQSAGGEANLC